MKARIAFILLIVLVLCLVAYLVSTGTQIRADLVKTRDEGAAPVLPEDGPEKAEDYRAGTNAAGVYDGRANGGKAESPGAAQGDDRRIGTGRYRGRMDVNFIELELEDDGLRSFQLSEALRENFDALGLKTGDMVRIHYREREGQNPIIEKIERHTN